MKMIRCRICGETYLGTETPSRCPFCGASERYMTDADSFSTHENDIVLTETERADIETAVEIERSNARYYAAMALLAGDEALASTYKRLSRVEAEHCSLFSKLLREPKPDDLMAPAGDPAGWCEAIAESAERERHAAAFYAEVVGRATNERVREIFTAVASVEADHLALDALAAERAGC